jgi:hypothetical protein
MGIVKAFKGACNLLFRCCNARSYLLGVVAMFMMGWKAVKPFLEECQILK